MKLNIYLISLSQLLLLRKYVRGKSTIMCLFSSNMITLEKRGEAGCRRNELGEPENMWSRRKSARVLVDWSLIEFTPTVKKPSGNVDIGCLPHYQKHRCWDGFCHLYRSQWKASCLGVRSHVTNANTKDLDDDLKSSVDMAEVNFAHQWSWIPDAQYTEGNGTG